MELAGFDADGPIQQQAELPSLVFHVLLEIAQLPFQSVQLIGQMQAGQYRGARGVHIARPHGDG